MFEISEDTKKLIILGLKHLDNNKPEVRSTIKLLEKNKIYLSVVV
jgi:hypothetical protein